MWVDPVDLTHSACPIRVEPDMGYLLRPSSPSNAPDWWAFLPNSASNIKMVAEEILNRLSRRPTSHDEGLAPRRFRLALDLIKIEWPERLALASLHS